MLPHLACPVVDASQIGDARRQAARLAGGLGFDEQALGRLAIVVTELATNLHRHADDGLLLMGAVHAGAAAVVELISLDRGPGMTDAGRSMSDGVSTGGTAGEGLGSIRRLSNDFHIFSKRGVCTVVVARLSADGSPVGGAGPGRRVAQAGICLAAPGETVSGDGWALRHDDRRVAAIMVDGLGHGLPAAAATDAALRVFDAHPGSDAQDLLERCHGALRSTRGAAVATLDIDLDARSVSYCGAGNIVARIISGVDDRSLLSQHGTVGLQMRKVQAMRYELPPHALLVLHSDGLATRWTLGGVPGLLSCDPLIVAGYLVRHHLRGRDDATVVVVRCD